MLESVEDAMQQQLQQETDDGFMFATPVYDGETLVWNDLIITMLVVEVFDELE